MANEIGLRLTVDTADGARDARALDQSIVKVGKSADGAQTQVSRLSADTQKFSDSSRKATKASDAATKATRSSRAAYSELSKSTNEIATRLKGLDQRLADVARGLSSSRVETDRITESQRDQASAVGGLLAKLGALAAGYLSINVAIRSIKGAAAVYGEIETGLVGVSKTTDIVGAQLDAMNESFGRLATAREGVAILKTSLLDIAATAGQVGVSSSSDLLLIAETAGKLEQATDLTGASAVQNFTRILNVQGEAISEFKRLGSVVVALGNDSAAFESQILKMTTRVALATSQFQIGSVAAAALGTAMVESGIQSELGGSVIGRTFREIQAAVLEGGKILDDFAEISGVTSQEFSEAFGRGPVEALNLFLEGLGGFGQEASVQLARVGLVGEEINQVLPTLAVNYERLALRQAQAAEEAGNLVALDKEAAAAFNTQAADLQRLENSYLLVAEALGKGLSPAIRELASEGAESLAGLADEAAALGSAIGGGAKLAVEALQFLSSAFDWAVASATALGVAFLALKVGPLVAQFLAFASSTTVLAAAQALATGATGALASSWTALTAAMLTNPIGVVAVALGVLTAAIGAVVIKHRDAEKAAEEYHERLRFGSERISESIRLHDQLSQTIASETENREALSRAVAEDSKALEGLQPILADLQSALDAGDSESFNRAAEAAQELGFGIESIGGKNTLELVTLQVEELEAKVKEAGLGIEAANDSIARSEADLAANLGKFIEAENLLRRDQRGELARLEAQAASARLALVAAGQALRETPSAKTRQDFAGLSKTLKQTEQDAATASRELEGTMRRMGDLAERADKQLQELFRAGDLTAASALIDKLPDDIFAKLFPGESRDSVLAWQAAINDAFSDHLKGIESTEKAQGRATKAAEDAIASITKQVVEQRRILQLMADTGVDAGEAATQVRALGEAFTDPSARAEVARLRTEVVGLSNAAQTIEDLGERIGDLQIDIALTSDPLEIPDIAVGDDLALDLDAARDQALDFLETSGDIERKWFDVGGALREGASIIKGSTGELSAMLGRQIEINRAMQEFGLDARDASAVVDAFFSRDNTATKAELVEIVKALKLTEEQAGKLQEAFDQANRSTEELIGLWVQLGDQLTGVLAGFDEGLAAILDSALAVVDAFKQLSETDGGIEGAIAGGQFGGALAGFGQQIGLFQGNRGVGELGGQLSGDFSSELGELGGTIGGFFGPQFAVAGAALGAIVGGLINRGADEALATLEQVGDDLTVRLDKVEGGLGPALDALTGGIVGIVEQIEAALGSEITTGEFGVKIRDDVVTVFINGIREAFKGDTAIEDAVNFAISELLKTAEFDPSVGAETQAALRTGFDSLEDLAKVLELTTAIDRGTDSLGQFAQVLDAVFAKQKEQLSIARERNISEAKVLELTNQRIEALKAEAEASFNSLLGITDRLAPVKALEQAFGDVNDGIERQRKELEATVAEQERAVSAMESQHEALGAFALASGSLETSLGAASGASIDLGDELGRTRSPLQDQIDQFGRLRDTLPEAREELEATREALANLPSAIDADKIADAYRVAGSQAALDLISILQQTQGEQFLAAEQQQAQAALYQLQLAAQIATVEAMLVATTLLDNATRNLLRGIVDAAADAIGQITAEDFQRPSTGGGGRSRREQAERELAGAVERIEDLRMAARGVSQASIDLHRSILDFNDFIESARALGVAEEDLAAARQEFLGQLADEILGRFESALDAVRGVSPFERDLADLQSEFEQGRKELGRLIREMEAAGLDASELARNLGELTEAERIATQALGVDFLGSLEQLGVALPTDVVLELAAAEFALAKAQAISAALALAAAGAFDGLSLTLEDILGLIAGAEFDPSAVFGDAADTMADLLGSVQEFLDLADGISRAQARIREIGEVFADAADRAEELGATEEDFQRLREAQIAALQDLGRQVLRSVQSFLDAALGIGQFERALLDLNEEFTNTRADLMATIEAIEEAGGSAEDLAEQYEELDAAQRLATQQIGRDFVRSLEALGVALPTEVVEEMARAEFELAKAQALSAALALAAAGAFDGMSISLEEILGLISGAEFEFDADAIGSSLGDTIEEIFSRFSDDIDLASGISSAARQIADIAEQYQEAIDRAVELGATQEEIDILRGAEIARLRELGAEIGASFQSWTDLAAGISPVSRSLLDMQGSFMAARRDTLAVIEALRGAGQSTHELETQLLRLETAQGIATRSMGVDFIRSLDRLGVSLPTELVLEMARAEFELAKAQALSSALALAAAGAFEGLSVSLSDVLGLIDSASFDASRFFPETDRSITQTSGGGRKPADDLAAFTDELNRQIDAWNRLEFGPITNQAIDLARRFRELDNEAKRLGVSTSALRESYAAAVSSFVDDALSPFEDLNVSPLRRELDGIIEQFTDIALSFEAVGASADQVARLQSAFTLAVDDFLDRATSGIRGFLEELRGEDPRRTNEQEFLDAQSRFQDLLARAQGGDLEAIAQLEGAAREFRDQSLSFLGQGAGSLEILDLITKGLESIGDVELVPDDIRLLEDQLAKLSEILGVNFGLPDRGDYDGGVNRTTTAIEDAKVTLSDLLEGGIVVDEIPGVINTLEELLGTGSVNQANIAEVVDALAQTLTVSDTLSEDQRDRLTSIIDGLLGLDFLGEEQRQELAGIRVGVGGVGGAVDGVDESVKDQTSGIFDNESSRLLNKLNAIRDRLGMGDVNAAARAVRDRIGTGDLNARIANVRDRLGTGSQSINERLLTIAGILTSIDNRLANQASPSPAATQRFSQSAMAPRGGSAIAGADFANQTTTADMILNLPQMLANRDVLTTLPGTASPGDAEEIRELRALVAQGQRRHAATERQRQIDALRFETLLNRIGDVAAASDRTTGGVDSLRREAKKGAPIAGRVATPT